MNKFVSIVLLVSVLVMSCSTTTSFVVYDQSTGNELTDYTIQIEGRILRYGETITLSNAAWKEYSAIVRKDGYMLKQVNLQKEIKPVPLIFGLLLTVIPLLWCYGPEPNQTFMLVKENQK
ncbi:MAG: hypothetical protein LBG91_02150 [Treponema sp.]|nr:hypothetical protein [Treponema sp.]